MASWEWRRWNMFDDPLRSTAEMRQVGEIQFSEMRGEFVSASNVVTFFVVFALDRLQFNEIVVVVVVVIGACPTIFVFVSSSRPAAVELVVEEGM